MNFRAFFCLSILPVLLPVILLANPDLVPDGFAGNPPDNQTCVVCHSDFSLNSGMGTIGVTGLPTTYQVGDVYRVSIFAIHPGGTRYGFQATLLDGDNNQAGTIFPTDERTRISRNPESQPDYISHSLAGTNPENQPFGWWEFFWIAPPAGTADVSLFVTTVGADNDLTEAGDYVYSYTTLINEDISTPPGDGEFYTFWYYHDFGYTPVGSSRVWETIGVNTGGDTLRNVNMQLRHGVQFEVLTQWPVSIPPSEVIALDIAFTPSFSSSFSDSLYITSPDRPDTVYTIGLRGFGTAPMPPTPFGLISPLDGETIHSENQSFSWSASTNPDSTSPNVNYQLQIDRESDFSNPLVYNTAYDSSFTISTDTLVNEVIYFWRVLALDTNTEGRYSSEFYAFITDIDPSGVPLNPGDLVDSSWSLKTSPNPFNSKQNITFMLPSGMDIKVTVFDIQGRLVAELANGFFQEGSHEVTWSGGRSSGVFFIRIQNGFGYSLQKKVLYLK